MSRIAKKELIDRCKSRLPDICSTYNLGDVKTVSMPGGGVVNLCFCVNQEYIIRFNIRDVDTPKFRREKYAYDLLDKTSVPAPEVIALDESKTILPYDILILNKLPGENVDKHFKEIDSTTLAQIAFNAGEVLAKIHSVECDHFGELYEGGANSPGSWVAYLEGCCDIWFRESQDLKIIGQDEESRFTKGFGRLKYALDEVTAPHLVHGDYSFSNVVYQENIITGVFDFEWCLAGDPEWDIHRTLSYCDEYYPGTAKPLREGYVRHIKLSKHYSLKSQLYECMWMLELSIVGKKYWSEDDYKQYRTRLFNALQVLEKIN